MLTALLLLGCSARGNAAPDNSEPSIGHSPKPTYSTASPLPSEAHVDQVESILASMTLEDKVGQLFFIAARQNADGQRLLEMDRTLLDTLKTFKPGGFIFFSENIDTIDQTKSMISDIQKSAEIPLFIGIDEEGGIVTRLNKAPELHSTEMPSPYVIGLTKNSEYAYRAAQVIASEIRSLGFNMNFAPVADVFSNPANKVIGKRAYSSDPKIAAGMVAEAVKGAIDTGIIPVLKHFPGHGDTSQDSHSGAAVVESSLEILREREFLPFKAGIQSGAEVIMTAHVLTPKITDNDLPATLSGPIINGILREELGFDGLIITDGLEMSAISYYFPEEEAVVLAIQAGVDMLLIPRDLEKSYNAVLSAVKEGKISEERLNQSVRRILKVKVKNIIESESHVMDAESILGSDKHVNLVQEIRKESGQ